MHSLHTRGEKDRGRRHCTNEPSRQSASRRHARHRASTADRTLPPVDLFAEDMLREQGEPVSHVYPPIDSVIAQISSIDETLGAGAGLIGAGDSNR
jgi:hypothetical protein